MCGIFGMIVSEGCQPDPLLVEKSTNSLIHRGPDDHGFFYKNQVALGSRRLAVIDLSSKGHQPMTYRNNTIVYNGEIYNYLEIRTELKRKGYAFDTNTDTEVVLAAYDCWGEDCVTFMNGMWAFAIYDPSRNRVFCSRDRFGIKPFYYTMIGLDFCFASEIKAFESNPDFDIQLNEGIAQDFLISGLQHHTNETFYKDVFHLGAGHHLIYDLEKANYQTKKYYSIGQLDEFEDLSFEEASEEFKNLLNDSIRLHRRSDVKIATALSGGLDSSSVLGLQYLQLTDQNKNKLEAINYDPNVERYDEQKYIKDLLEKYPVKLNATSKSFRELYATLDEVTKAQDEPLLSGSLLAQYEVFKLAKEKGIKVMLDGQGADELLAGYGTYYPYFFKYIRTQKKRHLVSELFGFFRHHPIPIGKLVDRFNKSTSYNQFLKLENSKAKIEDKIHNFRDYSIYMIQSGILPGLLQFEDRNSMAHSVESRVPFLDYRLVEFCMKLPPGFKIKNGVRKSILRNSMKTVLPNSILKRYDKLGFVSPQQEWMEENQIEFEEEIRKIVHKNPTIFDQKIIDFLTITLEKKDRKHYPFLWRVLSFGRWMEQKLG